MVSLSGNYSKAFSLDSLIQAIQGSNYSQAAQAKLIGAIQKKAGADRFVNESELYQFLTAFDTRSGKNAGIKTWVTQLIQAEPTYFQLGPYSRVELDQNERVRFYRYHSPSKGLTEVDQDKLKINDFLKLEDRTDPYIALVNQASGKPPSISKIPLNGAGDRRTPLKNGYLYDRSKNFVHTDKIGGEDFTRFAIIDPSKLDIRPIYTTDDSGNLSSLTSDAAVKALPGFQVAVGATFGNVVKYLDDKGKPPVVQPYGEAYYYGTRLAGPALVKNNPAVSIAKKRYALAIDHDDKPHVVLGGWKDEYKGKYKVFIGGMGLLRRPKGTSEADFPTEDLSSDNVRSLFEGKKPLKPIPKNYLPLVRDKPSLQGFDNSRKSIDPNTKKVEFGGVNISARTATVITRDGKLFFIYLEDGTFTEQIEPRIQSIVEGKGYEVDSILIGDGGTRARLFEKDDRSDFHLAHVGAQSLHRDYPAPIVMIGAFRKDP